MAQSQPTEHLWRQEEEKHLITDKPRHTHDSSIIIIIQAKSLFLNAMIASLKMARIYATRNLPHSRND